MLPPLLRQRHFAPLHAFERLFAIFCYAALPIVCCLRRRHTPFYAVKRRLPAAMLLRLCCLRFDAADMAFADAILFLPLIFCLMFRAMLSCFSATLIPYARLPT